MTIKNTQVKNACVFFSFTKNTNKSYLLIIKKFVNLGGEYVIYKRCFACATALGFN